MVNGSTIDAELGWVDDTVSEYIQLVEEGEYERAVDTASRLVDSECGVCVKMGMSLYGGAAFLEHYPGDEGDRERRRTVLDSANDLYYQVILPIVEETNGV